MGSWMNVVTIFFSFYQFDSFFYQLKDILWGLWYWYKPQSICRPPKLWGFVRGCWNSIKTTYLQPFKDIGDQMSLLGNKVFKYIVKFSLRFTDCECCYEIICLYYVDSVFHRIKDMWQGLWCQYTPQSIGRPPKLWGFVRGGWKSVKRTYLQPLKRYRRSNVSYGG